MNERRWWLDDRRWPVAGVIALVASAIAAVGGQWPEAAFFFAAAVALAVVTLKTARR